MNTTYRVDRPSCWKLVRVGTLPEDGDDLSARSTGMTRPSASYSIAAANPTIVTAAPAT